MEDIEKAYKIAEKTAGDLGMFKTDLAKADALLRDYGEKRDNLFNRMVSLLEKSEDGMDGEWKESCSSGKEALSSLLVCCNFGSVFVSPNRSEKPSPFGA